MLLDTFAWIEFFEGTKKGEKVKDLLKNFQCFTCAISLAELSYWCEKGKRDSKKAVSTVKKLSVVINLDDRLLELAGRINYWKKKKIKNFGMIDAIILTSSKIYNLNVVTGDKHFAEEEGAIML